MPLTPAEKMKRYREKLKKDPDRYQEYKKKDLKRIKTKNKKVSEMTDDEKEKVRKKWREQKKRQTYNKGTEKSKKNQQNLQEIKNDDSIIKKHIFAVTKWRRAYKSLAIRYKILRKKIDSLRKKFYRVKIQTNHEIEKLKDTLLKNKAREEVLECAMRNAYTNCIGHKEKRILKNISGSNLLRRTKSKTYFGKLLGLKGCVRIKIRKKNLNENIKQIIEHFFLRDDISRMTSGKKECKTLKKQKQQIRFMTDTLRNLYNIYKEEGGKYSFITFYRYKPFYVLSPNILNRESCLCIKHCNMEMLFSVLFRNKVFHTEIKYLTDVLACDINSYDCMYGNCELCNKPVSDFALEGDILNKRVQWKQWERIDCTYDKIEDKKLVQKITKKTVKVQKQGTLLDLIQIFQSKIAIFKIHYFNWKHQQRKYREKISNLGPTEVLILCDFSENYECKFNEEVQASHFIKSQITLHCGMIYWTNKSQSFCSIADNKCHEPSAIWAHLLPVIRFIKTITPVIKIVHFFSDGPSTQYRQKKNFFLLNHFTTELDLDFCTWNFSESGHGKGVADGIGGAVKRTLDKQVAYGRDISNGIAFEILNSVSKSIKYFYIQDSEINQINQSYRFDNLKAIPGTLRIHQILSQAHSSQIQHRVLSCFCQSGNDQVCECFTLKTHKFPSNISTNMQLANIPSTIKVRNNSNINVKQFTEILPLETSTSFEIGIVDHNIDSSLPLISENIPTIEVVAEDIRSTDVIIDYTATDSSPALTVTNVSIMDPNPITTATPNITLRDNFDCLNFTIIPNNMTSDSIDKDCKIVPMSSRVKTNNIDVPVNIDLTRSALSKFNNSKQYLKRELKPVYEYPIKRTRKTDISGKENILFNNRSIKTCVACKKLFFITKGIVDFDYICRKCLNPDE